MKTCRRSGAPFLAVLAAILARANGDPRFRDAIAPRAAICSRDGCMSAMSQFASPLPQFCTMYALGSTTVPAAAATFCIPFLSKLPSVCSCNTAGQASPTSTPPTTAPSSGTSTLTSGGGGLPCAVTTVTQISVVTTCPTATPSVERQSAHEPKNSSNEPFSVACCVAQPNLENGDFEDGSPDPRTGPHEWGAWTYTGSWPGSVDPCFEGPNCASGRWMGTMVRRPATLSQKVYVCACGLYRASGWFTNPALWAYSNWGVMNLPAVQFSLAGAYSETFVIPVSDTELPNSHWYEFSALLTVPRGTSGWQDFKVIDLYDNSTYVGYYLDKISLNRLDISCGC